MTSTSGLSEDGQAEAIGTIISGGFTLALLPQGHGVGFGDSVSAVSTAAAVSQTVAENDVTINAPADFSGVGDLELTVDTTYTAVDEGVLVDFAVLGDTAWALGEEIPGQPDTTGEDVTISDGQVLYEIGNL